MEFQTETNKLSLFEAENAQLKNTIESLHEKLRFKNQKSLFEKDGEIAYLKDTIIAVRDQMEKMQFEKADVEQRAVARANDEIRQLRETAVALRDQMEKMQFEKADVERRAVARANDEIEQLRETAVALRDQMEKMAAQRTEGR